MNIYGDNKICKMCKARADIIEKNIHYCAECYSLNIWKKPLTEVGLHLNKKEGLTLKVVKK
jgi:hypothetical protein